MPIAASYVFRPVENMRVGDFRADIPVGCLEGLDQYSHVWILFVFHCNTDLQRLWSPSHAADGLKAKVQVPRLNGGRMGVLATRSPHRPAPIGAPLDSSGSFQTPALPCCMLCPDLQRLRRVVAASLHHCATSVKDGVPRSHASQLH